MVVLINSLCSNEYNGIYKDFHRILSIYLNKLQRCVRIVIYSRRDLGEVSERWLRITDEKEGEVVRLAQIGGGDRR